VARAAELVEEDRRLGAGFEGRRNRQRLSTE
jgi:hypothetical protein